MKFFLTAFLLLSFLGTGPTLIAQSSKYIAVGNRNEIDWYRPGADEASNHKQGDKDFGGNSVRVDTRVSIRVKNGNQIEATIYYKAREQRPDHTTIEGTKKRIIYTAPAGERITRIKTPTSASAYFYDRDHEVDFIVPGRGQVSSRSIPRTNGLVKVFQVLGDRNGNDVNSTGVKIVFNPIQIEFTRTRTSAPTAGSYQLVLHKLRTNWFVPRHTRADRDFFGNGPRAETYITLYTKNRSELWATVSMKAVETKANYTTVHSSTNQLLWRAPAGMRIIKINSPIRSVGKYTDRDHEEDYVAGLKEVRPNKNRIAGSDAKSDPVYFFRILGDKNGSEAGTHTGMQAFFHGIKLQVSGRPTDNMVKKGPARPGNYTNNFSGDNSCGSSAGATFLQAKRKSVSYEAFKRRLRSSGNLVTDNDFGAPPGTLRDRIREYDRSVRMLKLSHGNSTAKRNSMNTVKNLLRQKKPVIALTGWASKTVRGYYAPVGDRLSWDMGTSILHYVVLNGIDERRKTIFVIDNGVKTEWSYEYLESVLFWQAEPHAAALFNAVNVNPGVIIY